MPVAAPEVSFQLTPGVMTDLEALRDEVHDDMQMEKPVPAIAWSTRRLRSYWGTYDSKTATVTINVRLQSSSVSRECLKFLVYHELLHHELGAQIGHRGDFRERERRYPHWAALSSELDGISDYFRTDVAPHVVAP